MGFLDALGESVVSGGLSRPSRKHSSKSHHKKRRSRSKSRSRSSSRNRGAASIAGSFFGFGDSHGHGHSHSHRDSHYNKHNSSRASFFGLGNNNSRSSFFGFNRSSYYKRSPRGNFMQRAYKQLKRILRDLVHYAKRHPWKVFFLVIMPLITGGALTALLARFGLRIPPSIERMIGMASRAASGDHLGLVNDAVRMAGDMGGGSAGVKVERGREGGMQWERSSSYAQNDGNDFIGDGLKSMAKMFS